MDSLLELFCDVDDFCIEFLQLWNQDLLSCSEKSRKQDRSLTISEIMTIMIAFQQSQYRNFKAYYLEHDLKQWPSEFPGLVSYTRPGHKYHAALMSAFRPSRKSRFCKKQ